MQNVPSFRAKKLVVQSSTEIQISASKDASQHSTIPTKIICEFSKTINKILVKKNIKNKFIFLDLYFCFLSIFI
jgi:hypothetical protein